jgi:hypothetical protein
MSTTDVQSYGAGEVASVKKEVSGPAPDHLSYRSFATFSDPDGNSWLPQEVTTAALAAYLLRPEEARLGIGVAGLGSARLSVDLRLGCLTQPVR